MALKGISVPALAAAGGGALVIWSGLKGASVMGGFRSLLGGQQPSGQNVNQIQGTVQNFTGSFMGVPGATGSIIADDALRYKGRAYKWAGASPVTGWDCSGFVNYVVGHDDQHAIPGSRTGKFSGHGPPTMVWAVWNGCQTIPRNQLSPGDLGIWPANHMGIAVSNSQMISALNPSLGTQVTGIDGTSGGPLVCRRLK